MPKPRQKRHWHWLKTGQLYRLTLIVTSICIPLCSSASGTTSYLTTEIYNTPKSNNNSTRSQLHTPRKQKSLTKSQELEQQNLQATQIKLTNTHQSKHKLSLQPTHSHESAPTERAVLAQTRNRPNVELNLPTPPLETSSDDDVAYGTKTKVEKHTHVAYGLQQTPTHHATLVKVQNVSGGIQPDTQTVEKINFSRSSTRISANWPQNNLKVNQVFESQRRMTTAEIRRNSRRIVLLGLFELSNRQGQRLDGWSELSAAQMAVEHINSKKILPDYTLELLTNDTQCDPGVGVDRFFHAIYTQPDTRMIMLLGSACSEVTESLAKVVPHWSIVQVSFGSTSPALSDRKEFPNFYRTVAPDSSHNPARIAFIRFFGWDTVTTFSQNEEVHSLAVNDLVTELEAANISCAATITFAATDFKEQLLLLRETDTRIIIGSFSQDLAPQVLCEAFRLRMFGADYAWILHESMGAPWWNDISATGTNCTPKELQDAVENLIIIASHNRIVGNKTSYSGLSNEMFLSELRQRANGLLDNGSVDKQRKSNAARTQNSLRDKALNTNDIPTLNAIAVSTYAPQTYDAVWAIALALRAAEERWQKLGLQSKLNQFDYVRADMAREFLQQMAKLDFLGVSGPVSFSGPDRIGTTAFYQIQNGTLALVALYYPAVSRLDFHCPHCRAVRWHTGQVPIARRIFKMRVATIATSAFYTIATLSVVGIILAIAFLAFTLHFRKMKAIKLSSPKLSNISAVGCVCVYVAVILLGLDYSTLPTPETSYSNVCTARVYLLCAGFSLAFGSMFAKTYRVHRIFTRTGSVFKDKMLQDAQLIMLVCILLVVDALLVTLWVFVDPMERHLHNLTLEISSIDRSVVYQPQVEVCRSQHTQGWLGALYAYKGLLLVVGVYMAWETRHVTIPALNDSQYIGVSVYLVVITSAIVVVLANLISERVTLAFITITSLILASTTATLCLSFIPKLHDIWGRNVIVDPVIHSMGLKMECNTRRFVIDDRRELQYRVEVQNRVYKKEIAALDQEIRKLERILEFGTASSATSSSSLVGGQQRPELTVTSDTSIFMHPSSPTFPPVFPALPPSNNKSRAPSISGILPNLLLSVLPPVIPRASWPSAEYMQLSMRRSIAFASQPQLEERKSAATCLAEQDLYNLRIAHRQATETKTGLINRLRGIFSRTASSNKGSSCSLGEQKSLRAAFKSHMGLFTRHVPTTQAASCNAIYNQTNRNDEGSNGSNEAPLKAMKRLSFAKSGTHLDVATPDPNFLQIPSISAETPEEPTHMGLILPLDESELERIGVARYTKVHETKVNFQLPANRRPSILEPQPSMRERVRCSPRFPHRVVPTSSLGALEEADDRSSIALQERIPLGRATGAGTWKSMEVTTESKLSLSVTPSDKSSTPTSGEVEDIIEIEITKPMD
ncbi:gamma-aminobutyric acid type B receptor subunit 1 [Bactrocera neohumeralis]|uniref:gamma-aminobutyric acid type B receptor subunit 1 n=1 Tax=Bactrocera neohumeralis TaxID=98809 RepID=UPI002165FFB8|nr:gamma-aminobutyric acid type B receptor subunit 1 [Bactrocera neohumeralis]